MLPVAYSWRNVVVRRSSALLTLLGIGLTVAVFAGVLSLREGLESVYQPRGAENVAIYLRPGAKSEGESGLRREQAEILVKSRPEIARDESGAPLAAKECFLAVYMDTVRGGQVNVPLRGIEPASLALMGDGLQLLRGRWLEFGTDEVVVGRPLSERMLGAEVGETLLINTTPFKVVGVYEFAGAQSSEVWGDVERMMEALDRPFFQRVVAQVQPGTDFEALAEELESDKRVPASIMSEREYLSKQTGALGGAIGVLAFLLTFIMSASAVVGSMNTMLAAVSGRTHEIGVLLAIGYSRRAIFLTFLMESALLGLVGGVVGVLLALPFHGQETGMMNFDTFTDTTFAFRLSPGLVATSVGLAFVLGLIGGALPAWRAARLKPVEALRSL